MTDFSPEESTRRLFDLYRRGIACCGANFRVVWTRDGAPMQSLDERDPDAEQAALTAEVEAAGLVFDPESQIEIETGYLYGYDDERILLAEGTSLVEALKQSLDAQALSDSISASDHLQAEIAKAKAALEKAQGYYDALVRAQSMKGGA